MPESTRSPALGSRLVPVLIGAVALLAATTGAAAAAAGGGWRWPLAGQPLVIRGFDPPAAPWAPGHRGVDLRAHWGDRVSAAGPGVVTFAGILAGRGVVAVHHAGGLETTYEPLSVAVHRGQSVAAGARLGAVLAGHGDCGPGFVCLHWGLRAGDRYLDPLGLLRSGPVRLLPVWRADETYGTVSAAATSTPPGKPRRRDDTAAVGSIVSLGGGLAAAALVARRRRAPP